LTVKTDNGPVVIALDQGTTSSRAIAFDDNLVPVYSAQREFTQHFPQPGWVEHDADEIWLTQKQVFAEVFSDCQNKGRKVLALGITNQRETTVIWSRKTGRPLWRALVWQDRRTEPWCKQQRDAGLSDYVHKRTGLVLDPYFSASKLAWLLEHVAPARQAAEVGDLAFGTVDSWLIWNLTGKQVHATDETNASRTMLYNLEKHDWDDALLARWHIPRSVLPTVQASTSVFGYLQPSLLGLTDDQVIPICGVAGDQQAALLGQGCTQPGQVKNTYGTGCFMLMHTGHELADSKHGLITTASSSTVQSFKTARSEVKSIATQGGSFALEGSVFIAGAAVQWLRDGLGLISEASQIEGLANSVPDSGDVYFVPAFAGLGSPYWDANARGAVLGLTRGTNRGHLARACLDAIAFQSSELALAMQEDSSSPLQSLRVDGGAAANNLLMQIQADCLQLPVVRPKVLESTARGAAALARVGAGIDTDLNAVASRLADPNQVDRIFLPQVSKDQAQLRLVRWREAVKRSRDWTAN
jgi:glycerol kinase